MGLQLADLGDTESQDPEGKERFRGWSRGIKIGFGEFKDLDRDRRCTAKNRLCRVGATPWWGQGKRAKEIFPGGGAPGRMPVGQVRGIRGPSQTTKPLLGGENTDEQRVRQGWEEGPKT